MTIFVLCFLSFRRRSDCFSFSRAFFHLAFIWRMTMLSPIRWRKVRWRRYRTRANGFLQFSFLRCCFCWEFVRSILGFDVNIRIWIGYIRGFASNMRFLNFLYRFSSLSQIVWWLRCLFLLGIFFWRSRNVSVVSCRQWRRCFDHGSWSWARWGWVLRGWSTWSSKWSSYRRWYRAWRW